MTALPDPNYPMLREVLSVKDTEELMCFINTASRDHTLLLSPLYDRQVRTKVTMTTTCQHTGHIMLFLGVYRSTCSCTSCMEGSSLHTLTLVRGRDESSTKLHLPQTNRPHPLLSTKPHPLLTTPHRFQWRSEEARHMTPPQAWSQSLSFVKGT